MSDELLAAAERYANPNPTGAYPWPCEMHEQPVQRSVDSAVLARAWLAEHTWTSAPPNTPGWYWYRDGAAPPEIREVRRHEHFGLYVPVPYHGATAMARVSESGQWAGPLTAPADMTELSAPTGGE